MVIDPGDLIVGDADGVLAISLDDADRVLKAAQEKQAAEELALARISAGEEDRTWVTERWRTLSRAYA